jgi:VanZ family protein
MYIARSRLTWRARGGRILTLLPGDAQPEFRKLAPKAVQQYGAYMLAGGMLALGCRSLTGRCILATLLPPFALGLQVAQSWIPGRTPSVLDFANSAFGAVLGVLLGALID